MEPEEGRAGDNSRLAKWKVPVAAAFFAIFLSAVIAVQAWPSGTKSTYVPQTGAGINVTVAPLVTPHAVYATARPVSTLRVAPAPPSPTRVGPVVLPLPGGEATCLWTGILLDCGSTTCMRIGTLLNCDGPNGNSSTCTPAGTEYICDGPPAIIRPVVTPEPVATFAPVLTSAPIPTYDWCARARADYSNPGSIYYLDEGNVSIWCH